MYVTGGCCPAAACGTDGGYEEYDDVLVPVFALLLAAPLDDAVDAVDELAEPKPKASSGEMYASAGVIPTARATVTSVARRTKRRIRVMVCVGINLVSIAEKRLYGKDSEEADDSKDSKESFTTCSVAIMKQ